MGVGTNSDNIERENRRWQQVETYWKNYGACCNPCDCPYYTPRPGNIYGAECRLLTGCGSRSPASCPGFSEQSEE